jgi:putative FmdB family regulatory protein
VPLYEYECEACGQRFEKIQKFSDEPLAVCAKCGKGPIKKLFSSPAIQFKGSGWYITDYANKGKGDAAAAGKPGSGSTADTPAKTDTTTTSDSTKSDATKSESTKSESTTKSDSSSSSTKPSTTKSE